MTPAIETLPLIGDELDFLAHLVPLAGREIIELRCGAAGLARSRFSRCPDSRVTGLEADARQHAKNLCAATGNHLHCRQWRGHTVSRRQLRSRSP